MCMHTYIHTPPTHTYTHTNARACAYIQTCIHTYIHTYIFLQIYSRWTLLAWETYRMQRLWHPSGWSAR